MKRYTAMLCLLGMLLSTAGCSASEDAKKEIVSIENQEQTEAAGEHAETNAAETEKTTEAAEELPQIEQQVLWEIDGVIITATGISEDSFWGTALNVLVENNSDKDVSISLDALIVNDFMFSDLTVIDVTAGNKSNESITIFSSELEAAGIDSIGKIEMYMHTYDPESYQTLNESDCITLTTSVPADTEADISGVTLFEQNDVKIIGQYVDEDSIWGTAVLLYIENNSGQNLNISAEDVAVNGFMISAFGYETVYAGKKAITDIYLSSSDLEENGITSVETVELSFSISDENYSEIANSGKVSFAVK